MASAIGSPMPEFGRWRAGPPPWWPPGESWPPQGGEWSGMRGRFVRRIAIGFGIFFLFVFLIGWLGAALGGWTAIV